MRISRIDLYLLNIPLNSPLRFETVPYSPNVQEWPELQTVLVCLWSGDICGWGEAAPGNGPFWTAEWSAGAYRVLRDWISPLVLHKEFNASSELAECLAIVRGHRAAKAALDIAFWDLKSRIEGRPLYAALGGTNRELPLGTIIDRPNYPDLERFVQAVADAFQKGFSRVAVKIRPGLDLQLLNVLRHEFPVADIHGDLEGALNLGQMEIIYRFDDFNLRMLEQPLSADDLVGHAMVQEALRTPICLDESITTPAQADMALELHSAKYFNLNPVRVGGLTPALAIHQAAHEHCVPCYLGMYPQTAVGTRAALALGTLSNFCYPADYWGPNLLAEDVGEPVTFERDSEDGKIRAKLWENPGLGITPDPKQFRQWILEEAHLD
ncbi:MAG: enolase C-terminal domain-like protein [Thermogutta sp.]|jgi:O-succinylbenzoate synthase